MKFSILVQTNGTAEQTNAFLNCLFCQTADLSSSELILLFPSRFECTEQLPRLNQTFGSVILFPLKSNPAKALFRAAKNAKGEFLLFLDIRAHLFANCIEMLQKSIHRFPKGVGFGICKFPTADSTHFDPVSLVCPHLSFDCTAVKRSVFLQCGGFDSRFSVHKDIDLSWRLRMYGDLHICPGAKAEMPQPVQDGFYYAHSAYETLLLSCKYHTQKTLHNEQHKQYINCLKFPKHYPNIRKQLLFLYGKYWLNRIPLSLFSQKKELQQKQIPDFQEGFAPQRGTYSLIPLHSFPLVSVIVRTHNRKETLRMTLQCLQNQTYPNFEVVIVEDGSPTAETMVLNDFPALNIRYFATGQNVGRGKAGNIGIEMAQGEYLCFLDDDDFYYPDCIESYLSEFQQHPEKDIVFSASMLAKITVLSKIPYRIQTDELVRFYSDRISLLDLCVCSRIPISGAMFKKTLYQTGMGMREDIDGNEDWAMWLRFFSKSSRPHTFPTDIPRALSLWGIPADTKTQKQRFEHYALFEQAVLSDKQLRFTVAFEEILHWQQLVKADMEYRKANGLLADYLKTLRPNAEEKPNFNQNGTTVLTAQQINHYYYYLVKQYL